MKKLFIICIFIFSKPVFAQFFDANGKFLNGVTDPTNNLIGWKPLEYNEVYTGVVSLAFASVKESLFCSGSLITKRPIKDDNPVYVLTNGHCSTFVENFLNHPELIIKNKEIAPIFLVLNNFSNTLKGTTFIPIVKVLYARVHKKDIAFLETNKIVKDFKLQNVKVYTFAQAIESSIVSVGTPLQDLPIQDWVLHISVCETAGVTKIIEGDFESIATRNNCSLAGGQSGSPLFNSENEIVAIQNTGYDSTLDVNDCELGKPCETLENRQRRAFKHWSYAQDVINFNSCFDENAKFNDASLDCPLLGL